MSGDKVPIGGVAQSGDSQVPAQPPIPQSGDSQIPAQPPIPQGSDSQVPNSTQPNNGISETLDATVAAGVNAPSLSSTYESKYDLDKTRSYIAYWLLLLLTIVIFGAFVMLINLSPAYNYENLKGLVELVLGPIIALVSAATGFYFGSQQASKNNGTSASR